MRSAITTPLNFWVRNNLAASRPSLMVTRSHHWTDAVDDLANSRTAGSPSTMRIFTAMGNFSAEQGWTNPSRLFGIPCSIFFRTGLDHFHARFCNSFLRYDKRQRRFSQLFPFEPIGSI